MMNMKSLKKPKVIAYRNRYDIMAKILETVGSGLDKGRLIKSTNTPPELSEAYVELLMKKGLLKVADIRADLGEILKVTDKGVSFLTHYKIIQDLTK